MSELRKRLAVVVGLVTGTILLAALVVVVLDQLASSDLSWLPAFDSKQDDLQVRFANRFQRHQDAVSESEDVGPIRCGLTPWTGPAAGAGPLPDLRLELTNTSPSPIRLWYVTSAECHVTFLVRDEDRAVKGSVCFGSLAPVPAHFNAKTRRPEPLPPVLLLQPGETHSLAIRLRDLRDRCSGPGATGLFFLEAVFLYEDLEGYPESGQRIVARSQPVAMEVGFPADNRRPAWRLPSQP